MLSVGALIGALAVGGTAMYLRDKKEKEYRKKRYIELESIGSKFHLSDLEQFAKVSTEVMKPADEEKAGTDVNEDISAAALIASLEGNIEMSEALIKAVDDINARDNKGNTALMLAAAFGKTETVSILIKAGADVNANNNDGFTALMFAVYGGYSTDTVKILINAGADVNDNKYGCTVLMLAAAFGKTEMVHSIISAGADVNARDNNGNTALIMAAILGKTENADVLIKAGADVNARNNDGKTAYDYALENPKLKE